MANSIFAIDDFMSKLDNRGSYAKSNRFTVEITKPQTLITSVQPSVIEFLIKSVSFPARTFGTTTYRSGGKFGLDVPYEMTEEPIAITFLGTNDWSARDFWNDWIMHIQNTNSYNMQYYKQYIGTVKISVYDEGSDSADSPTHQVTLHECWPKGISAVELGWESSELIDFEVDIAYSWWTTASETPRSSTVGGRPKRSKGGKNKKSKFALTPGGKGKWKKETLVDGVLVTTEGDLPGPP